MVETFPINRMKEGLEGLSPIPTGPALDPQGFWKTQGLLSLGALGLALLGTGLQGGGLAGLSLYLRKKSPPPRLGDSRDLGLGGRGWGEKPPLQSRPSPQGGGQTQPLLLGSLQHVWRAGGDSRNSRERRGCTLLEVGNPCPAGRDGGGLGQT